MSRYISKITSLTIGLLLLAGGSIAHFPPKSANIAPSMNDAFNTEILERFGIPELSNQVGKLPVGIPNDMFLEETRSITSQIRPGDIILVRGTTWIDQVIRIITGSTYTHVAGAVKPHEAVDILPFSKTGCKSLFQYSGHADVFTCDKLTDEQRRKIVDYAVGRVGTSYDYKLVLWQASRYLFHWVWPYHARENSLCSTLWADAYRKAGIELCPNVTYPSPGDLAKSPLLRKVLSY